MIDNFAEKANLPKDATIQRASNIYKLLSNHNLESKFVENIVYNTYENLDLTKAVGDRTFILSKLIDSSISLDKKKHLINKVISSISDKDGTIIISDYNINTQLNLFKIIGTGLKLCPDIISQERNDKIVNYVINTMFEDTKFKGKLNVVAALSYLNIKNLEEEERQKITGYVRVSDI